MLQWLVSTTRRTATGRHVAFGASIHLWNLFSKCFCRRSHLVHVNARWIFRSQVFPCRPTGAARRSHVAVVLAGASVVVGRELPRFFNSGSKSVVLGPRYKAPDLLQCWQGKGQWAFVSVVLGGRLYPIAWAILCKFSVAGAPATKAEYVPIRDAARLLMTSINTR